MEKLVKKKRHFKIITFFVCVPLRDIFETNKYVSEELKKKKQKMKSDLFIFVSD